MENLSLQEIIESIRREDKKVLMAIYKNYFPSTKHYILSNSGTLLDAEDIFQDTMVLVYLKIKDNNLKLSCNIGTYLFAVSRYLWLRTLAKRKNNGPHTADFEDITDLSDDLYQDYIQLEKKKLIIDTLELMSEDCKKLLLLYLNDTPEERIVLLMNYSSVQYARNRRTSCKDRLVKKIWNSHIYKELSDGQNRKDLKIPRW